MSDSITGQVTHLIYGLERINQIIDLCIDRELYDYVEDILPLDKKCSKYLEELRHTRGKRSFEEFDFFTLIDFPVPAIRIPSDSEKAIFFKLPKLFKSKKPPFVLS